MQTGHATAGSFQTTPNGVHQQGGEDQDSRRKKHDDRKQKHDAMLAS
jgi:hypothetical protein